MRTIYMKLFAKTRVSFNYHFIQQTKRFEAISKKKNQFNLFFVIFCTISTTEMPLFNCTFQYLLVSDKFFSVTQFHFLFVIERIWIEYESTSFCWGLVAMKRSIRLNLIWKWRKILLLHTNGMCVCVFQPFHAPSNAENNTHTMGKMRYTRTCSVNTHSLIRMKTCDGFFPICTL